MRRWMSHHYSYRPTPSSRRRATRFVRGRDAVGRARNRWGAPRRRRTKVSPSMSTQVGRDAQAGRENSGGREAGRVRTEVERAVSPGWGGSSCCLVDGQSAARRRSSLPYRTTMPVLWSARGP